MDGGEASAWHRGLMFPESDVALPPKLIELVAAKTDSQPVRSRVNSQSLPAARPTDEPSGLSGELSSKSKHQVLTRSAYTLCSEKADARQYFCGAERH